MALPQSELNRVKMLVARYAQGLFAPLAPDHKLLMRVGSADPTALDEVVSVIVQLLNAGRIDAIWEVGTISWLNDFANISEYLRAKIASTISSELVDFWCSEITQSNLQKAAQQLSDTLKLERPKHYFDLSRNILTNSGSIVIIGAGFSYDSYTPLLHEMEGIACCTLSDLGVTDPRHVYHTDEKKAWEMISGGWKIFQKHVAFTLLPKEPSEQHVILAELFHAGHVSHIVSFNWDDLVEKAYRRLYSEDIPRVVEESATSDHALWKLHGDIADPEERWVLPFEAGRVFSALEQLALHTTLPTIVIGYREQESIVREKLITVLENRAGVTRIRPDLTNNPPESFADNALWAMKKLKAGLESAKQSVHLG